MGVDVRGTGTDRSVAELSGDLVHHLGSLIHDEVQLAKVEMSEKAKRAGLGAGMFGTSGVLAVLGLGCLTAAGVAGIALAVSVWLAALIIGAAYLAIAGIIALAGRDQLKRATPPLPVAAVESSKEDLAWLKMQARSDRR